VSASQQQPLREKPTSVLVEISNEIVRVYKEQFGRGPTRARAAWAGDNVLTVVLEDTFTPAERTLQRLGQQERLREMRTFLQYTAADEFCAPVERLTGRTFRAFVSGIDTEADGLSVETFIFHPVDASGRDSRREPGRRRLREAD
jgi:uncharacterized protein YbcI